MAGSKGPATSNQERSFLWYGQSWSLMNFHIIPFIMFKILSLKYAYRCIDFERTPGIIQRDFRIWIHGGELGPAGTGRSLPAYAPPKTWTTFRRPCFRYAGQGPSCPCLFPLPDQIHRVMVRPPVTSYQRSSRCRRTNKELATEPL